MLFKKKLTVLALGLISGSAVIAQQKPAEKAKMDQFVNNLIGKMTLDEKIGQLTQFTSDMALTGPSIRSGYKDDIQ
ncbi:MAG: bglX, partial [Mucilaginibacter sp.]|nr:bglX [Mucilaginibacter sp.]